MLGIDWYRNCPLSGILSKLFLVLTEQNVSLNIFTLSLALSTILTPPSKVPILKLFCLRDLMFFQNDLGGFITFWS